MSNAGHNAEISTTPPPNSAGTASPASSTAGSASDAATVCRTAKK
ncbi:hypothetical protein ABZX85_41400 [Streptomyces sp. NPDC004539]